VLTAGAAAGIPVRVALALGDPEREGGLLSALHESGEFTVAERCLAAGQLLDCLHTGRVDVALVARDLHRLGRAQLAALKRGGVPVLLFAPPALVDETQRDVASGGDARPRTVVLPFHTPPEVVRQALLAGVCAEAGDAPAPPEATAAVSAAPADGATVPPPAADARDGSPGRSAAPVGAPPADPFGASMDRQAVGRVEPAGTAAQPEARRTPPGGRVAPAAVLPTLWPATLSVLVVGGGHGSPGRTTVALNLAVALGAVARTVLVDLAPAPAVASYLDADPTRNVFMLSHGEPESPRQWEHALAQETQPLGARSPHGSLLCGVPKPEMRSALSGRFVERLVAELRQRYHYVILDVGASAPTQSPGTPLHEAVLGAAAQVLLVTAADLVGLTHARAALAVYQRVPGVTVDRLALVVNRYDRRYHYRRSEIEWALGVGAAAVVPFDHAGAERALAAQRPLVLDGRSRAARAVMELADRLHGGSVLLPPEPAADARAGWGIHGLASGGLAGLAQRPLDALRRVWIPRMAAPARTRPAAPLGRSGTPQVEGAPTAGPPEGAARRADAGASSESGTSGHERSDAA
jgi:MinD-like ATPase involved in chromosome partitioning or flagellar assembly